ncbi:adrenocortical dysplasia protein homolog [Syngnathus acus]|uniref:adrenocortical dysplasia protein homolog n=1 Tax=Syngnathus acus TaxID=161584 RepID=UPI001885AFCA|nr:adrenocortical dysplasia protein homolog [Syngnathus acus]XP_037110513.1 adrenocortical dysplasia protein homolog [Syngnathus acus]XP_037110514.1 adrenocortical dysplasia protein homolog [Syngnathus acus]
MQPLIPKQDTLSPWIEKLIQSYDSEKESPTEKLRASVTSIGLMSPSQAQNQEEPTDLIFLSDGTVEISSVLTPSAWKRLQESERRETFFGLVNNVVCISNYQLKFHPSTEPTQCKFFLLIDSMYTELIILDRVITPCCTSLVSVQQKILETWRVVFFQETQSSQMDRDDLNLSELLVEWQNQIIQETQEDSSQEIIPHWPSIGQSLEIPSETFTLTSWDIERLEDNDTECFSVPIKCLLIPEGHTMQGPKKNAAVLTTHEDAMLNSQLSENSQSRVHAADRQIADLTDTKGEVQNCGITHDDDVCVDLIHKHITPLEKPWEIFPPPNGVSPSSVSEESMPMQSPATELSRDQDRNGHVDIPSTRLPMTSPQPEDLQNSKSDHYSLPPYQKALSSDTANSHTAPQDKQTINEIVNTQQEPVERQSKRKREWTQEAQTAIAVEEGEAQLNGSPPSWLFDAERASGTVVDSFYVQTERRPTLTVHADGEPFSYTYVVSEQNLQDFSKFQVAKSLLSWAIKYLVPKRK